MPGHVTSVLAMDFASLTLALYYEKMLLVPSIVHLDNKIVALLITQTIRSAAPFCVAAKTSRVPPASVVHIGTLLPPCKPDIGLTSKHAIVQSPVLSGFYRFTGAYVYKIPT